MSEEIYNQEIVPLLEQVMEICNNHSLDMLTVIGFEQTDGDWALGEMTIYDPDDPLGRYLELMQLAIKSRGNVDTLIRDLMVAYKDSNSLHIKKLLES